MNEHDLTLIIDLVDGRLPPDEEKAAHAVIAADPELRAAYASQMAVADRLAGTPQPSMTPAERERLHTELKAQLRIDESPAVGVVAPSRWNRWLAPLAGFAVAAAVIVGAVVVLPGTLSSNDADEVIEAASAPATTSAASAETPVPPEVETAQEAPPADTTLSSSGGESQSDAVTGHAYDQETTAADVPFVSDVNLDELAVAYAAGSELRQGSTAKDLVDEPPAGAGQITSCLASASTNAVDSTVTPLVTTVYDGVPALVVAVQPASGTPYLVVSALDTCEELADTRP